MSNLIRVAFVKFSPNGTSYPARCDREDISLGDQVEVLMKANTPNAYYLEGTVVGVQHERWHCTCRVENLVSEVEYLPSETHFIERRVNLRKAEVIDLHKWRSSKDRYRSDLPDVAQAEMKRLYEEIAVEDAEPVYLSDGMWLTPDGELDDQE